MTPYKAFINDSNLFVNLTSTGLVSIKSHVLFPETPVHGPRVSWGHIRPPKQDASPPKMSQMFFRHEQVQSFVLKIRVENGSFHMHWNRPVIEHYTQPHIHFDSSFSLNRVFM